MTCGKSAKSGESPSFDPAPPGAAAPLAPMARGRAIIQPVAI
jgi:hypothetical protein